VKNRGEEEIKWEGIFGKRERGESSLDWELITREDGESGEYIYFGFRSLWKAKFCKLGC
jgi:hypothetical protein